MNRRPVKMRIMIPGFMSSVMAGFLLAAGHAFSADLPMQAPAVWRQAAPQPASSYHWTITPVEGAGAELLTLVGRFDGPGQPTGADNVPLVAVLRDNLSDANPDNDRLRYVYLLTLIRPTIPQRLLSAVPFFYWQIGEGNHSTDDNPPKPLLDMAAPRHRVWTRLGHTLLQWTAFDPMMMPIRASSRAYRTNEVDHERLHIEEALSFLRQAPADSTGRALTRAELDSVIARLTLAKNFLGGLMSNGHLERVVRAREAQRAATIGRNWELLRTSAERAGLIFEPLHLSGGPSQYAVLWFPVNGSFSAPGISLKKTWKLLNISNPWRDARLNPVNGDSGAPIMKATVSKDDGQAVTTISQSGGYREVRYVDATGGLLPRGQSSPTPVTLAPLAVYSLTYPRMPLLLIDFRSHIRTKWREIFQRTRDDAVSGVLRLSHFTNWYYYAGDALYQFVKSRRGAAVNQDNRLDCYSEFRVAVALDRSLNPDFREELRRRIQMLTINPLEASPGREVAMARVNYRALENAAANPGQLPQRLEKDRRQELAAYGESHPGKLAQNVLHYLSLGIFTDRTPRSDENASMLDRDRRTESLVRYLHEVASSGVHPEVSFDAAQIRRSIDELATLVSEASPRMRTQAVAVLTTLLEESQTEELRADCARALLVMNTVRAGETAADNDRLAKSSATVSPTISGKAVFGAW